MRPLLLKMKGFESYFNETTIDFEKLGNKGLYRITGETGAGKTTIFDAITFALYGESSGTSRDWKMLRSNLLKEGEKGFVDLTFAVGNNKYRVYRDLVNDKGSTKVKKVFLEFFDGKPPVEAVTKVNEEIAERILQMNQKDFCQIEMIAQGAFEKFLLAKTDEKEKIFREIFHTEKYMRFQDELKNKTSFLKSRQSEKLNNILILLDQINIDGLSEEDLKTLETIKATQQFDDEAVSFLKTTVKADEKLLKKVSDDFAEKSAEKGEADKKIEKARQRASIENSIENAEKEKKSAEEKKDSLEEDVKKARERKGEQKKLGDEKARISVLLPKYQEVTETEKALSALNKEAEEAGEKKIQLEEKFDFSEKKFEQVKEEYKNLSGAGENQSRLENEYKQTMDSVKAIEEICRELDILSELKNSISGLKEKASQFIAKWQEEEKKLAYEKAVFSSQQAGILAEGLKEGDPCPVCGNTHHIKLAEKTAGALTKEQLESLEKQVKSLENAMNDSSTACKVAAKEEETKTEILLKRVSDFIKNAEIDSVVKIEAVSAELEKQQKELKNAALLLNEKITKEAENVKIKEKLEKEIPETEKLLENLRQEISAVTLTVASKTAEKGEKTKLLEKLTMELEFESQDAAEQRIKALEGEIKAIDEEIEKAEKALNECLQKIAQSAGMIAAGKEQLDHFEKYDFEKLNEEIEKLEAELKEVIAIRDAVNSRLGNNRSCIEQIEKLSPEYAELRKKYETVKRLFDIAAASTGMGNEEGRISLETYIQMQYLEKVLVYANNRLSIMSDGVYDLVRSSVKKNGKEKTGLDLSIYDHNACDIRPVETLSGGEKFQASLALALGLADEITMSGSGIKMESMFIDEGFATLDSASLRKVMKTLNDLSSSDRLIGIISHVGALDGEIPKTIDVVKDKTTGISSAKVNTEN